MYAIGGYLNLKLPAHCQLLSG